MNKRCQHIITGLLFLLATYFVTQQNTYIPQIEDNTSKLYTIDTSQLFQKIILPNRMHQIIQYLNQNNIQVSNNYELLLLLSNRNTRLQLQHQFQINTSTLLIHAELADLMQIGMTELDAQILLFSQRNYQNPFTGTTINLKILSESNPERILQDISGWMVGNENPLLQKYTLSVEEIESWISQAKGNNLKIFAQIP